MTWRRPIMAAIVLAALAAIYFAGGWALRQAAMREEQRERLLPQDAGNIARLEIENDHGRIVIERGADEWRITEPVSDRVDESQLAMLLQFLNATTTINRFTPGDLSQYKLDDPPVALHVTFQDGSQAKVLLGSDAPQPQKIYAMIDGAGSAFLLNRAILVTLDKDDFAFRDKTILAAMPETIMDIRLQNATGAMHAIRDEPGGPWRLTQPVEYPADDEQINGLIRRLSINKLLGYVEPEDVLTSPTTWQSHPEATLSITWQPPLGEAAQTLNLIAGPKHPVATAWYAKRQDRDDIFLIGAEVMEEMLRPPDQYRDKQLFTMRPDDVTSVEMTLGRENYTLERNAKGEWIFSTDAAANVFNPAANLFLDNLLALKAETFETDTPGPLAEYGLEPPRLLAVITGRDGQKEGMSIGALSAEKSIVYVRKLGENVILGLKWTTLSSVYKFKIDLTDRRLIDQQAVGEDVVRIITTEGGETRTLERRGDKCFLKNSSGDVISEVSPISALDYITRFATLQYYRTVPENEITPADAGLDKPIFTARLEDKHDRAVATLEFGSMMDDKIFMRLDGRSIYMMKLDDWKDLSTLYHRLLK